VDGNYQQTMEPSPYYCASTNSDLNAWWSVDLQVEYRIFTVRIWNRGDGVGDRLTPLMVEALTSPSLGVPEWTLCDNLTVPGVDGFVYNVSCGGVLATSVKLTLIQRTNFLTLCEVEIWATDLQCEIRVLTLLSDFFAEPYSV
jgi:hypothetical protein